MPIFVENGKGPFFDDLTPILKDSFNASMGDVTLDQLLDMINNTP